MPQTPDDQHVLERRSSLLAARIKQRIADTALALQASHGRIPFRTTLSRGTALDWWVQHRYDAIGAQALQGLSPVAVMSLDNALNQYAQEKSAQGLPQINEAMPGGSTQPTINAIGGMIAGGQSGTS